jgi:hypothetical protein
MSLSARHPAICRLANLARSLASVEPSTENAVHFLLQIEGITSELAMTQLEGDNLAELHKLSDALCRASAALIEASRGNRERSEMLKGQMKGLAEQIARRAGPTDREVSSPPRRKRTDHDAWSDESEHKMTRWFVGVKGDGQREVFADSTGADPTAKAKGYVEVCGPYRSEQDAAKAARGKPSIDGGSLRNRRKS